MYSVAQRNQSDRFRDLETLGSVENKMFNNSRVSTGESMLIVSLFASILLVSLCVFCCALIAGSSLFRNTKQRQNARNERTNTRQARCDAMRTVHTPTSSKETAFLGKIRSLSAALVDALGKENDPIAKTVAGRYISSHLIDEVDGPSGRYSNGCVHYNVRSEEHVYNDGRLRALICHELAHAWGRGHDTEWLRANAYLLRVASQKLGWKPLVRCNACDKYGLCDKTMCPQCTWEDIKSGKTHCP